MPRFLLVVLFALLGGGAHAQGKPSMADRLACTVAADDPEAAIASCTRVIEAGGESNITREPNNRRMIAFCVRGMLYFQLDDLAAAEIDVSDAIKLEPEGGCYSWRGDVHANR